MKIVRQRVSGLPHGAHREIQRRLATQGVTLSEGQISRLLRRDPLDARIAPLAAQLKAEGWQRVVSVSYQMDPQVSVTTHTTPEQQK